MVSFTKNQQAAVDVCTSNILVSAAAGSGKTAVLTQRVIRLLTGENPIAANRLVIVTFTVAAAQEMRQRIAKKLSEMIEKDPHNSQLLSQQLLLSTAKISTIHSLCSSLIKENFQKLGLPSDFRIADETQLAIIKSDAVSEVFEEYYKDENAAFIEIIRFVCTKNDKKLVDLCLSIYDFIRSFAFPKKFLRDCKSMYMTKNSQSIQDSPWFASVEEHVIEALESARAKLISALEKLDGDEVVKPAYSPAISYDMAQIDAILAVLAKKNWDEAVTMCKGFQKLALKGVRGYEDKDFLEEIKALRKSATDTVGKVAANFLCCTHEVFLQDLGLLSNILDTLFEVVDKIYDLIEEKKAEMSIIDYADLEHYALKLLLLKDGDGDGVLQKSDIAKTLGDSFDEIMVDECQDINEVQDLIFKLMSKDEQNIFMVGDVKQSIYRFRKAMPSLFIQKRQEFSGYDPTTHTAASKATITLENNFRSRSQVCDTINFIFHAIMSRKMGEIQYDTSEELVASASYSDSEINAQNAISEFHLVEVTKAGGDKTKAEAQYIAAMIKKMVEDGHMVEVNGVSRPCRYGDFAILLRAKKGKGEVYVNGLKAANINCFCDSTDGYFGEYEIAVTLNLLRVIDNPLQDICLASVIMSPMFGFDADMIARVRLSRKNAPLYMALVACAQAGDLHSSSVMEAITRLRQASVVSKVSELLTQIYDQTDFVSLVYALGNGTQRDANLRLMLDYAARYEKIGSSGLSGFLRYIDRVIASNQDFSCANTQVKDADTVKLMSIHSSKGLEFPIAILADCAKGFNKMDLNQSFQFNSKLGFGMKIVDDENLKKYSNLPFEAIKLATAKETISEEMRVLYVALTRAREKLIMVATMSDCDKIFDQIDKSTLDKKVLPFDVFTAKSYAEWIMMALQSSKNFTLQNGESVTVSGILVRREKWDILDISDTVFERACPPDESTVKRLTDAFAFEYVDYALTKIPAKLTATQMSKKDEIVTLKLAPSFLTEQGLTPAQRGTILHSFMQYADFNKAAVDLDLEIARLVKSEFLTEKQSNELDRDKLLAFLKSPLFFEMNTADELLREYKFLHFLKAGDVDDTLQEPYKSHPILIQGIADCVIIKDGKAKIVDYKTDITTNEEKLRARYTNQLLIYKGAIEQALELPVSSLVLYSLHLKKEIAI